MADRLWVHDAGTRVPMAEINYECPLFPLPSAQEVPWGQHSPGDFSYWVSGDHSASCLAAYGSDIWEDQKEAGIAFISTSNGTRPIFRRVSASKDNSPEDFLTADTPDAPEVCRVDKDKSGPTLPAGEATFPVPVYIEGVRLGATLGTVKAVLDKRRIPGKRGHSSFSMPPLVYNQTGRRS